MNSKPAAIFLLAAPFWTGEEKWKQGLKLKDNFTDKLPSATRMYFYHCRDDEEVPFNHLEKYKAALPDAIYREFEVGGHQFFVQSELLAQDIFALQAW